MATIQPATMLMRRICRDEAGLALVEFAYAVPFMLLLTLGGAEMANLAITHARISSITSMVADGVARVRDRIDENDINDIITGAKLASGSLNLTSNGRIIISTVEDNAATTTPTTDQVITWQRCKGTKNNVPAADTIGSEGAVLTNPIGETGRQITAKPGNPVIIVQIFYDYQPLMTRRFFNIGTVKYTSAFSVRDRTLQTLQNGQNLAANAKATCNYFTS
ncbi:TadE/TadG family type IV pilus assembly protein [Sphingobium ummariense]|uniref:Tight adherence protein TadE n=1 Tax=Sphingobium ummariense RL-3 TaxID=1346791 RepID=T0KB84_9SPHN|nr:hypothetical protein [Sphingobium ummariense]EQB30713.1 hypothetical protein M529_18390 [Sphingobium ummariense RL-3]